MSSIKDDQFLSSKYKYVQIERSSFLKNHYARKSLKLKDSQNPRDPFGSRLSHYWEQGDTILSVTYKKIKANIQAFFDPDTYDLKNLKYVRQYLIKQKVRLIGFSLCIFIPFFIIYPLLRPRIMKIRRQFLFQFYLQNQVLSHKLNTKATKIPKQQMQEIIKNINSKIKF